MSNLNNLVAIDSNAVFFDNDSILFRNLDKSNINLDSIEKKKIQNGINVLNEKLNINLFSGARSGFLNTKIINNHDLESDINNLPFNDSISYKGYSTTSKVKVKYFKKTYGLESKDDLFNIISNEPFEDAENLENVSDFLDLDKKLKYPKYYNAYSLNRLNSNISVFGTIQNINGEFLTEKPLQGIKCELVTNSTDSRDRNINIENKISIYDFNTKGIESYSDEEYKDMLVSNDSLLQVSFKYTTRNINGSLYSVLETSTNSNLSSVPILSNKIIFYTEDALSIAPFDDSLINNESPDDYSDRNVNMSCGYDTDNSEGGKPQSIGFIGELN